ncbi:hypothetical protein BDY19DRAFT_910816 [Irpex rosettiformis]|uniref:Uncharacterized protein n=1 Tax=Irpex rosettiformis TaxID=378272 RepID=A0ACB8TMC1_9APHY|nr:hypothetical protein BDY19DRAFT_910816 [Irpex rosettiformis]
MPSATPSFQDKIVYRIWRHNDATGRQTPLPRSTRVMRRRVAVSPMCNSRLIASMYSPAMPWSVGRSGLEIDDDGQTSSSLLCKVTRPVQKFIAVVEAVRSCEKRESTHGRVTDGGRSIQMRLSRSGVRPFPSLPPHLAVVRQLHRGSFPRGRSMEESDLSESVALADMKTLGIFRTPVPQRWTKPHCCKAGAGIMERHGNDHRMRSGHTLSAKWIHMWRTIEACVRSHCKIGPPPLSDTNRDKHSPYSKSDHGQFPGGWFTSSGSQLEASLKTDK